MRLLSPHPTSTLSDDVNPSTGSLPSHCTARFEVLGVSVLA
jgi:hypothetical protein